MLLADRRNDLAAQIKYGESIEPAINKVGPIPPVTRALILQLLSRAEYKIGNFPAAVKWARRMVQEAEKTTLPALQGEAYFILAEANYKSGHMDGAADAANRAREQYARLRDENGLGHCEKVLGNAEMGRGAHNPEAADHYRKAIEHYTHVRNEHGLGNCYFNLGAMAKAERKWPEAIKALEEAVFHFVSSGSPGGAGMAKTQLGAVLSETNELAKARVVLEEAKTLLIRDNAPNRLAELDFILGQLYEKLNESLAAKQAYQEALRLYGKANDTGAMKPVQEALARMERADGR
jgi:tetratricopeptide (TPR) repeat protein